VDELLKLLTADDPRFAIEQMLEADIFPNIFAEIDGDVTTLLDKVIEREQAHDIAPNSTRRLFALLPKDAETADKITKKLRLSKKLQRAIQSRITVIPSKAGKSQNQADPKDADLSFSWDDVNRETTLANAYNHGEEAARDAALLFASSDVLPACLSALDAYQKPVFPIKGGDLIAMGMEAGPTVAATLAKIEQAWIDEGFPNEKRVRELASKIMGM